MIIHLDKIPPCKICTRKHGYRVIINRDTGTTFTACEWCGASPIGREHSEKVVVPTPDFGDIYLDTSYKYWVWAGNMWRRENNFNRDMQKLGALGDFKGINDDGISGPRVKAYEKQFSAWELRLLRIVEA